MLSEKLEVHFPYPGHFIEEDQSSLEEGIDLAVLGREDGGIQLGYMLHSEYEIQFPQLVGSRQLDTSPLHDECLFDHSAMSYLKVDICQPGLDAARIPENVLFVNGVFVGDKMKLRLPAQPVQG